MIRSCPYCRDCECGREPSLPQLFSSGEYAIEVYNAYLALFSQDRTLLECDEWHVAQDLVYFGLLDRMPSMVDVGAAALDLIREVEA
jgi:hypothetical protein